jgi:hypothetical protein
MRFPIAALAVALLSPQLGALASPAPQPATLEDLNDLSVRLGNGEPVPEGVQMATNGALSAKVVTRDSNYCGKAYKGTCCCNYCNGWMCVITCGVVGLCH